MTDMNPHRLMHPAFAARLAASLGNSIQEAQGHTVERLSQALDLLTNDDGTLRACDHVELARVAASVISGMSALTSILPMTVYQQQVERNALPLTDIGALLNGAACGSMTRDLPYPNSLSRAYAETVIHELALSGQHATREAGVAQQMFDMAVEAGIDPERLAKGDGLDHEAIINAAREDGSLKTTAGALADALGLEPGSLREVAPGMFTATIGRDRLPAGIERIIGTDLGVEAPHHEAG